MLVTSAILKQIIPSNFHYSDVQLNGFADTINKLSPQFEINTPLRICHFISQSGHESEFFKFPFEIWGPTEAQKGYEGRKDLGNDEPGDGYKFRGRGWFQTTGRYNYEHLSKQLNVDFVSNPDLLAQIPYCGLSAGLFWRDHGLNALADLDNCEAITRKINGGLNGLSDRLAILAKCKLYIK